jgi:DNA polymerase III subunit alpha
MRRAMGKKDKELMSKQKSEFIAGAVERGFSKKIAGEIFDMIQKFASYGFNKSHSVAYSVLAYQTAYLKSHYPAEYMAAAISAEIGDTDYVVQLIEECRKLKLSVLPPDVNESDVQFVVTKDGIRFGLSAIKNVGIHAVESIIQTRRTHGRFENLFDFCRRVDLRIVNKKTLESLIQAGAFDSIISNRAQLFESIEKAIQYAQNKQTHEAKGQSTLFEASVSHHVVSNYPQMMHTETWTEVEKLKREKSVLGFYVSGHPLSKYELDVIAFSTAKFCDPSAVKAGTTIKICGIVSSVKKKIDKKGKMMAFASIEDFSGKGECIIFSDTYKKYQETLDVDSMIMVIGKAEQNGDALRIIVNEIHPMDTVREKLAKNIILSININEIQEKTVTELKNIVERHRGKCSCFFQVVGIEEDKLHKYKSTKFFVQPNDEFISDVRKLLGTNSIKITA